MDPLRSSGPKDGQLDRPMKQMTATSFTLLFRAKQVSRKKECVYAELKLHPLLDQRFRRIKSSWRGRGPHKRSKLKDRNLHEP